MIDLIVTFLQDSSLAKTAGGSFTTIDYAFTMEPVAEIADKVPALFIYPTKLVSGPRLSANRPLQRTDYHFSIQVVDRIENLDQRNNELFDVLLGHQFSSVSDMTEHVSGEILGIRDPIIWYAHTFKFITKLGS